MPSAVVPHYRQCFWCGASLSAMPAGVLPHYRSCLLLWCLTTGNAFWCGASLSAMPAGVLPHYRSCLLVWCLFINHAYWCGTSSSTMPVCVVPHYRPCLLAWYLTICHAFWSIATAINILLVECRWKKGGYKSGATCTEVPLYQTCLIIHPVPLSDMPSCTMHLSSDKYAGFMNSSTHVCKVLYQARYLVCYKSIRHACG